MINLRYLLYIRILVFKKILSTVYINEMFKDLSNFFKSKNGKWILVIIIVLFVIWAIMSYSNGKGMVMDGYGNYGGAQPSQSKQVAAASSAVLDPSTLAGAQNGASSTGSYALQQVANPADLLPKDANSQWTALNPSAMNTAGGPIAPDLLQAGNLIGLDTVGQTLKNANLQLRSDPVIVKQNVGPWNNSTYEADLGRVPLELGCGQP